MPVENLSSDGVEFLWAGESWLALPQRALYRFQHRTVYITDPHFGKDESFRVSGVGLPTGTLSADLQRLSTILETTAADRLVILGDFFHDREGASDRTLADLDFWLRQHHGLDVILVRGNHDARAGDPPPELGIRCVDDPLLIHGLCCAHHPVEQPLVPTLAGHVHPAVRLGNAPFQQKFPCFHFRGKSGLLPAFGSFTGTATITLEPGDQVLILHKNTVRKIF
ncbi:MAG: ligase-associated DNA damage response endonuclease PdeM [Candidatus Sumerlaeia bacterium]|nr:ligase-associated DNA damage response endonuclease PdeM [Candidatus Sumerlaeia bacterium]